MKKTYIKPLASAITLQTEGSMLLSSPETINVDAGKETNERWSQKKDGPWNNNNSEGIWGGYERLNHAKQIKGNITPFK